MMKKLDEMSDQLLKNLEDNALALYLNVTERYAKLKKQIEPHLTTPEDISEMDKIKANMSQDTNIIHRDLDDSYKIVHYLLTIDHIFSDNLIYKTDEVIKTQKKFREYNEE